MKRDVTVVIPTRNRRDLLSTTLRSVLQQRDVEDLQIVVVDDGSTDGGASGLQEVCDPRVRLVRHRRPLGVSSARNHGATEAASTWLAFCDDDDVWAPEKLARQLDAAHSADRAWAYGGAVRVDASLRILGGNPPPEPAQLVDRLPRWNTMPGGSSNVIVRADVFRATGGWDPALVNLADWELWARLALAGLPACVHAPLVGYRIHHGNASSDTTLVLREARVLDRRFGAGVDYGELHHYLGWVCLRSGRRAGALAHFARAAARGRICDSARAVTGLALRWAIRRVSAPPHGSTAGSGWTAEAEKWIAPLRAAAARTGSCT